MYTTDNGPHMNTWPDGGMTPFRSEKNTNWEGAYRVPAMVRWPGKIKPGTVLERDRQPPRLAADVRSPRPATPTSPRSSRQGHTIGDTTFKVHLDGYNLLPYLTGEADESPRKRLLLLHRRRRPRRRCATTTGRSSSWSSGRQGTLRDLAGAVTWCCACPKFFNLRTDPYERADITSNTYYDWMLDHVFLLVPAQAYVGRVPADVQRVPAAAEGGELQPRPGDGEAAGRPPRLLTVRLRQHP